MGEVYLADDPDLERDIAIKRILPELVNPGDSTGAYTRLLREAQAMAQVSHNNVVRVFDVEATDDELFIAMEYLGGGTLSTWLRSDTHSWHEILSMFCSVGCGLAAAHAAGLVHRDFKPSNVLIDHDKTPKVSDFGLARPIAVVHRDSHRPPLWTPSGLLGTQMTETGEAVGTPAYMAPEQQLARPVDHRADQFSFCVAMFRALFGVDPFPGQSSAERLTLMRDRGPAPIPPPKSIPRRDFERVHSALTKGLSAEPNDRWPSMEQLLSALRGPRIRSRRRRAVVAGGALIALAISVSVLATRRSETGQLCTFGEREIASVWNHDRHAHLERAFTSLNPNNGGQAIAALAPQLDAYAHRWARTHRETCLATRQLGTQSHKDMERRIRCLGRLKVRLDAFVQLLSAPENMTIAQAPMQMQTMPSPNSCAKPLHLPTPPPGLSPSRRKQLEHTIAALKPHVSSYGAQHALPRAIDLLQQTRDTQYPPLIAEAALLVGQLYDYAAQYSKAEAHYHLAVTQADLGEHDIVKAQAYVELISISTEHGRFDEAKNWAQYARAAISRSGTAEHPILTARLEGELAIVARDQGDAKRALHHAHLVIRILNDANMSETPHMATARGELGKIYYGVLRDYAKAYQEFEAAHQLYGATLGANHPEVGYAAAQMADTRELQPGGTDDALALSRKAIATLEHFFGPDHVHIADVYAGHASILERVGRTTEAVALMKRAVALDRKQYAEDHALLHVSLGFAGMLYARAGEHKLAVSTLEEAIAIAEKQDKGRDEADVTGLLFALSTERAREGRYEDALHLLHRAMKIIDKYLSPNATERADTLTQIGVVLLKKGDPAAAVAQLEKAMEVRRAQNAAGEPVVRTMFALAQAMWHNRRQRTAALSWAGTAKREAEQLGDHATVERIGLWLSGRR